MFPSCNNTSPNSILRTMFVSIATILFLCLEEQIVSAFCISPSMIKAKMPVGQKRARIGSSLSMTTNEGGSSGITIYGHPGTRSPLINWACYELDVDFEMAEDLRKNPHPFGQLPCITDGTDVIVFESGAILQYLQTQKSRKTVTPGELGAIMSWITWANASLDPICFLETPDGKVCDTGLRNPNNRRLKQLNQLLTEQQYLVKSAGFTAADVAVGSYLLYVLLFFPKVLDKQFIQAYPSIVRYMKDCVSRPAYSAAFGEDVQENLLQNLSKAKVPAF